MADESEKVFSPNEAAAIVKRKFSIQICDQLVAELLPLAGTSRNYRDQELAHLLCEHFPHTTYRDARQLPPEDLVPMLLRIRNKRRAGGDTQADEEPTGRKATVNARMLEALQEKYNERSGWGCKQWATHLKCGKSTVVATETWNSLTIAREQVRAERAKRNRRRPKASDQRRD